jgi:ATP phosphoribosyltransferase regulatory subunit HisZ
MALPQRLYYDQKVYRANPAHNGSSREIPQCGVELIGAKGLKADLEIIVTAIDSLRSCGAPRFHVELGHAGFFRDLAARLDLDDGQEEEIRTLVEGKNFAALNAFLSPYRGNPACAALEQRSWPKRRGWRGKQRRWTISMPSMTSCPPLDTDSMSVLTLGWSTRSTTILVSFFGAM